MRILRLSLILLLAFAAEAHAQIPEGVEGAFRPHPEAREAISRLYSPFCPGFMLEICQASESVALRDSIQALAYEGWTADELTGWFLANHGEQYLAVPDRTGWGAWAWLLPPLGLLAGAGLVLVALRRFGPEARDGGLARAAGKGERAISEEEEERLRMAIREIELSEDPSL